MTPHFKCRGLVVHVLPSCRAAWGLPMLMAVLLCHRHIQLPAGGGADQHGDACLLRQAGSRCNLSQQIRAALSQVCGTGACYDVSGCPPGLTCSVIACEVACAGVGRLHQAHLMQQWAWTDSWLPLAVQKVLELDSEQQDYLGVLLGSPLQQAATGPSSSTSGSLRCAVIDMHLQGAVVMGQGMLDTF